MHEGLADALTYLRSGNACIGESICTPGSSFCATATCLRTGKNDAKWSADTGSIYEQSLFVSAMIWDLYETDRIDRTLLAKVLLRAIGFLPQKADFEHLVVAMMQADRDLAGGVNCQKIYNRAIARGLGTKVSAFSCANYQTALSDFLATTTKSAMVDRLPGSSSGSSDAVVSPARQSSGTKKSSSSICGVIGGVFANSSWLHNLLMLLPIVAVYLQRGRKT
jgi:hypothetical protein